MLSHFSRVQLFATLWTIACQAPLSKGFSRQEWSGLPCPPPGALSIQGSNLCLIHLLHWQVGSLPLAPPGKPAVVKINRRLSQLVLPKVPLSYGFPLLYQDHHHLLPPGAPYTWQLQTPDHLIIFIPLASHFSGGFVTVY